MKQIIIKATAKYMKNRLIPIKGGSWVRARNPRAVWQYFVKNGGQHITTSIGKMSLRKGGQVMLQVGEEVSESGLRWMLRGDEAAELVIFGATNFPKEAKNFRMLLGALKTSPWGEGIELFVLEGAVAAGLGAIVLKVAGSEEMSFLEEQLLLHELKKHLNS